MERTIIVIGSIAVMMVFFMLVIVAVPGCREWLLKLATCSSSRSQTPLLPVMETAQAQPLSTGTPEQQSGFLQRQVEALRNACFNTANVKVSPATHQPTRHTDLNHEQFKQKHMKRSPGNDARQDEIHRKTREGYKPAPFIRYY